MATVDDDTLTAAAAAATAAAATTAAAAAAARAAAVPDRRGEVTGDAAGTAARCSDPTRPPDAAARRSDPMSDG